MRKTEKQYWINRMNVTVRKKGTQMQKQNKKAPFK